MKNPIIPGLNLQVHSIFCIGRNYAEHAKELGNEVPKEPIVFLKPLNTICFTGSNIELPIQTNDVHHEVELVLAIGKSGKNISIENALDHIAGYGIGIDFTARDIQKKAKEKGQPWSIAKGFDNFAPLGNFIPFDSESFPVIDLNLTVNSEPRQQGSTHDMIFDIPVLISFLSSIFTLEEGDLIFTGTPNGVSAIQSGDIIEAHLENKKSTLKVIIS